MCSIIRCYYTYCVFLVLIDYNVCAPVLQLDSLLLSCCSHDMSLLLDSSSFPLCVLRVAIDYSFQTLCLVHQIPSSICLVSPSPV
jgi:hypothetical protein